ncbi:MAG: DUF4159 domain-containing protein [Gemmatimonadaceae bacterium]|nr:DUF4159 domain-containing protein [Gemmatimonadaceae bacterium]
MRPDRRAMLLVTVVAGLLAMPRTDADAQGRGRGRDRVSAEDLPPNVPYDGRWTFARIRYSMSIDAFGGRRGRDVPWAHDYPRGERNFSKILGEISTVRVRMAESVVISLNDPELFKYPVAYMAEAGYWSPNEAETAGLRAYLLKGGFVIFDDFAGQAWNNFERQLRRVMPELRLIRLTAEHPIFDSFFKIPSLDYDHPYYGVKAEFWALFEDNDPRKRMLVIANYNNDLSEYWEYSGEGMFPIDLSNESYKLGINYIVYALTR